MASKSLTRLSMRKGAHDAPVWACCWVELAGEARLLTGGLDESVKAWRLAPSGDALVGVEEFSGEAVSVLGILPLAASSTGLAATSSLDSTVRVWDLATNTHKAALEAAPGEVWGVAFAPGAAGASRLACAGGASASVGLFNLDAEPGAAREATCSLPSEARPLCRVEALTRLLTRPSCSGG